MDERNGRGNRSNAGRLLATSPGKNPNFGRIKEVPCQILMKTTYLSVFLTFAVCNIYAQGASNSELDLVSKYDSAKAEFESHEKLHGGYIQTKNTLMHYLHWGNPEGTPLIWVHGSFTNAYELAGLAEDIVKKGFYLIAIDMYGHGSTTIPKHQVSLHHLADDMKELMDAKRIKRAIIGGWSRGGTIATAFYDSYPERVLGLILEDGGSVSTNTYYHKMDDARLKKRVNEIFQHKASYSRHNSQYEAYKTFYDVNEGGTQYTLLAWISKDANGFWTIGPGLEELFNMKTEEQFLDTILRPTKTSLFAASMSMIEPKVVYRNLSVPMLILDPVADNDIFPYEKENEELAQQHPKLITHKKYRNTGHNIHFERPEMFVEDVGGFLELVKDHWKKIR